MCTHATEQIVRAYRSAASLFFNIRTAAACGFPAVAMVPYLDALDTLHEALEQFRIIACSFVDCNLPANCSSSLQLFDKDLAAQLSTSERGTSFPRLQLLAQKVFLLTKVCRRSDHRQNIAQRRVRSAARSLTVVEQSGNPNRSERLVDAFIALDLLRS